MTRRTLFVMVVALFAFCQFGCQFIPEEKSKAGGASDSPAIGELIAPPAGQEGKPTVTLFVEGIEAHTFPTDGAVWKLDVPSNVEMRLLWIAESGSGGAEPAMTNFALDPADPGDETQAPRGVGGWMGWGDWKGAPEPLVFGSHDAGQVHTFHLKMRDASDAGSELLCRLEMTVVNMPFDRTVLVVDDATPPRAFAGTDAEHDAFTTEVLECLELYLEPGEEIDWFDVYSEGDISNNPQTLPLETIGRYKLVVWNSFFFARQSSGLAHNEFERGVLSAYVKAGGRLYLYGSKPVSGLADDNYNDSIGDGICPDIPGVDDPAWGTDSFIWKFLHIRNCVRSSSSDRQQIDGWIGAEPVHPLYPDIDINTDIWDPNELNDQGEVKGGIIYFQVYKEADVPTETDVAVDTIYVAKAMEHLGIESPLDGQPCAIRASHRIAGPAQHLPQGRVFLQTFPFVFVRADDAKNVACRVIKWLMTGRDE